MSKLSGYLIAAGLAASPLRGQNVAQIERRLDSTYREAMRAQQEVLAYRAAHRPTFDFSDSIVGGRGNVKIYFDSAYATQARAGFREAEKHLAGLGDAIGDSVMTFSITPDSAYNPYDKNYSRVRELNVRQHFAAYPNNPSHNSVDGDPESIAYVLVRAIAATVAGTTPSHIGAWLNGVLPVAPDLDPKTDWAAMRLDMVSSPSHVGRECYGGDLRACRIYLGLDSVADPIHQLFDTTGRRLRVSYEPGRARMYSAEATNRCLGGNDDACVAVLGGIGGVTVLSSPYERSSLVSHALKLGGPRAAERLIRAPGKPGDALAAAAQMPLDSLLADWQRHLGDRTGASGVPMTIAISSIVWIGICVFLALRSSRWR